MHSAASSSPCSQSPGKPLRLEDVFAEQADQIARSFVLKNHGWDFDEVRSEVYVQLIAEATKPTRKTIPQDFFRIVAGNIKLRTKRALMLANGYRRTHSGIVKEFEELYDERGSVRDDL